MSSSSDNATSATTSTFFRLKRRARPSATNASSFSAGTSPGRDACSAGAAPKTRPVRIDRTRENASTRRSRLKSSAIGSAPAGGGAAWNDCTTSQARNTPAAPPIADSSTLSVSSCRTMRQRLAPSASRIATSRRRAAAFDSSRFATLAHAINSTAPTTQPSSVATERSCCRWF